MLWVTVGCETKRSLAVSVKLSVSAALMKHSTCLEFIAAPLRASLIFAIDNSLNELDSLSVHP